MEFDSSPLALRWLLSSSIILSSPVAQEEITVQAQMPPPVLRIEDGEGLRRVAVDGQLFCEYRYQDIRQPILYPLIGPNGQALTRSYPLDVVAGEERSDPQHQSLWFSHSNVNGKDFWTAADGCRIEHLRFFPSKQANVIHSQNIWMDGQGKALCLDERRISFVVEKDLRWIDYEVTLFASEGAVTFGQSKEGGMAIRLAAPLRLEGEVAAGRALNSEDESGEDLQGSRASWVDYSTGRGAAAYGLAIFDHPENPGHPSRWNARENGLCAATPFSAAVLELAKGERKTFRYRILMHKGDVDSAGVGQLYEKYARGQ